jgi:hypothetical protein
MAQKKHQPGCPCCGPACFCNDMPDTLTISLTYHNDSGGTTSAGGIINKRTLVPSDVACLTDNWIIYYKSNSFINLPGYPIPAGYLSGGGAYMSSRCPSGWDIGPPNHLFVVWCPTPGLLKLVHILHCSNSTPCWGNSGHQTETTDVECNPLLFTFPGSFVQIGTAIYTTAEMPDISAIVSP